MYALLGIYFASIFFFALKPILGWPIPRMLGPVSTLFVWGFALGHALWMLGWRRALTFFGAAFVVGLALEAVGVATGWVYGGYHYSPRLGPQWFGVPILIPLSWFMVIYLAHAVTERLIGEGDRSKSLRGAVLYCLIGAVVATAWDVVADPQMARSHLWVWDQPGEFFGIPVQNFVGWMITSLIVLAAYRALTWRWPPPPIDHPSPSFALLPIVAYGGLALSFVIGYAAQGEAALAVIAFFTMGALSLTALGRAL